ncbi:hypothetical protein EUGRSUZ_F02165 [Eucalyptus grandis]|uniref:Uncharacterized protein n=2 Tax=Eucalyptus grandis TaxID=71139 RepID=A0ACC3KHI1_EUCGR|nr:hypothetical protein EUGRSUZ_F02165 [Eucalyptus grandis]
MALIELIHFGRDQSTLAGISPFPTVSLPAEHWILGEGSCSDWSRRKSWKSRISMAQERTATLLNDPSNLWGATDRRPWPCRLELT